MPLNENILLLGSMLAERGMRCAVAESCTGGMLGAACTALPGASQWFMGGVIAYDNRIKARLLGVPQKILRECGAVSEAAALAMARGVKTLFEAHTALAVTGIAGPGGGSPQKPPGLVWIACVVNETAYAQAFRFPGSREEVRRSACGAAARMLLSRLS